MVLSHLFLFLSGVVSPVSLLEWCISVSSVHTSLPLVVRLFSSTVTHWVSTLVKLYRLPEPLGGVGVSVWWGGGVLDVSVCGGVVLVCVWWGGVSVAGLTIVQ